MELQYYTLDKIPDFTMAKYSAQESGDVEDILKQHSIFYRQLHRRGLMSGETYTLLYQYDPGRPPGKKAADLFPGGKPEGDFLYGSLSSRHIPCRKLSAAKMQPGRKQGAVYQSCRALQGLRKYPFLSSGK